MIVSHETIMSALFARLVGSVVVSFTGNTVAGQNVISNLSSTANLFQGLPVFGPGIPFDAVVTSIDTVNGALTLSDTATANQAGAGFTTGFQTTGRRVLLWSKVAAQPALFLRHTATEDIYQNIITSATTIHAEVWIYSKAGLDLDVAPDTALNYLVDAVRNALLPDNPVLRQCTLGGLVNSCRVEGRSEYDPGDYDGQAKAILPIQILCP
jgi:hypothetical protein